MKKIGYARVSTEDQHLDLQRDALTAAGCTRLYEETLSGASRNRPALRAALRTLRRGDVLVVWKLDRLGRSLQDLCNILGALDRRGINFHAICSGIDTTTPGGRLLYHVTGAMAEFERALISERTRAGLQAARRQGRQLGRPRRLDDFQVCEVRDMALCEELPLDVIATRMNVSKSTVWRVVRAFRLDHAARTATGRRADGHEM